MYSIIISKTTKYLSVLNPIKRGKVKDPQSLVDVLHNCLLLWEKGDSAEIRVLLQESKLGSTDGFWKYCQAVAESLPSGNKEKQLLEGFLIGRERYSNFSQKKNERNKMTYYLQEKE